MGSFPRDTAGGGAHLLGLSLARSMCICDEAHVTAGRIDGGVRIAATAKTAALKKESVNGTSYSRAVLVLRQHRRD